MKSFISNSKAIAGLYSWLGIENKFMPDEFKEKVNNGSVLPSNTLELQTCKRELYKSYNDSIEQLEGYLGRKINVWGY